VKYGDEEQQAFGGAGQSLTPAQAPPANPLASASLAQILSHSTSQQNKSKEQISAVHASSSQVGVPLAAQHVPS
jgi:hypothetical protein